MPTGNSTWIRGLIVGCAALALATPAFATDSKPHIDVSQPHAQVYPETAQRNGEQGNVVLKVYVYDNGRPGQANVAQSSGFPDLDNAAVESAMNWRYIPATKDGSTVADWATVQLVYKVPEIAPAPSAN
ncbi:MAG TPA: energy transducer TonB [Rhizomicrobium sp.]|jgi:protein TonB|nr:energy transducer TonB [Rhizomicrobium sp.]